jgi:hypothetical protein
LRQPESSRLTFWGRSVGVIVHHILYFLGGIGGGLGIPGVVCPLF